MCCFATAEFTFELTPFDPEKNKVPEFIKVS